MKLHQANLSGCEYGEMLVPPRWLTYTHAHVHTHEHTLTHAYFTHARTPFKTWAHRLKRCWRPELNAGPHRRKKKETDSGVQVCDHSTLTESKMGDRERKIARSSRSSYLAYAAKQSCLNEREKQRLNMVLIPPHMQCHKRACTHSSPPPNTHTQIHILKINT